MTQLSAPEPLKDSVGTIGDVMVVVAVIRTRRCCGSAHYRSHTPANRGADTGTMPAARNCANHSSRARAEQSAANRTVGRIVWVCERGGRQH